MHHLRQWLVENKLPRSQKESVHENISCAQGVAKTLISVPKKIMCSIKITLLYVCDLVTKLVLSKLSF